MPGGYAVHQITRSVAGSGRLKATFDPTGQNHEEPGNSISVGIVGELGNRVLEAGSATAWTLEDTGVGRGGSVERNEGHALGSARVHENAVTLRGGEPFNEYEKLIWLPRNPHLPRRL